MNGSAEENRLAQYRNEQELSLVARSALCVLWHAEVEDRGGPELAWKLRVFAEERGEFVDITQVGENYHVHAWYFGRGSEQALRMGKFATERIRADAPGYRQEFMCAARDGSTLWFQEDTRIEKLGENRWHLYGVSMDITERKKAEQERERLLGELKTALADVRQLRGMLPICANCKKIRDDAGYWEQIESYMRDRIHVEFSHSICPECEKKLYPDLSRDP